MHIRNIGISHAALGALGRVRRDGRQVRVAIARRARGLCSATLITALTLQAAVGCSGPADPGAHDQEALSTEEAPAETTQRRFKVSTQIEGSQYSVDLLQDGDRLTGVRTIMHADGHIELENVDVSVAELTRSGVEQTLTGAGFSNFEIVSAQPTESGMLYEMEGASGLVLDVETEGDVDYNVVVVAAAVVMVVAIVVCGIVAVENIRNCAANDRCWSYKNSAWAPWSVCIGSCQNCQ